MLDESNYTRLRARHLPELSRRLISYAVFAALLQPGLVGASSLSIDQGVFVTQELTDNAEVTAGDKVVDLISTVGLSSDVEWVSNRVNIGYTGSVFYQKFIQTEEIDDYGVSFSSSGEIEVLERFLSVDGDYAVDEFFEDRGTTPATERLVGDEKIRAITGNVSPILRFTLMDTFDFRLRGRIADVDYQNVDETDTASLALLEDSTIYQAAGLISTAGNVRKLSHSVAGEYIDQDTGFEMYYGLYSLQVDTLNSLQLVGRFGYEDIFEEDVTDISGTIWTAGFIASPGDQGSISFEYGRRFGGPYWDGSIEYPITGKLRLTGIYEERLETSQARLERSLVEITDLNDDNFELPTLDLPNEVDLDLIGGTFKSEDAIISLRYIFQPVYEWMLTERDTLGEAGNTYPGTNIELFFRHSRSEIFNTGEIQTTASASLVFTREINRRNALASEFTFERETSTDIAGFQFNRFLFEVDYSRRLAENTYGVIGYAFQNTASEGDGDILENVLSFQVRTVF